MIPFTFNIMPTTNYSFDREETGQNSPLFQDSRDLHPRKFAFWTQNHGGLLQMIFRISSGWFLGSKCNFQGCIIYIYIYIIYFIYPYVGIIYGIFPGCIFFLTKKCGMFPNMPHFFSQKAHALKSGPQEGGRWRIIPVKWLITMVIVSALK